jgi:hypothetical protein
VNRSSNEARDALDTTTACSEGANEPACAPSIAIQQAELIAASERALRVCVAAYSTGDSKAMMRAFTSDSIIEYALEEPSTYLLLDVSELIAANISTTPPQAKMRITHLWISPTNDRNSVFVHYKLSPDPPSSANDCESEHLALIEMRGDRIARMREFNASPETHRKTIYTRRAS